MPLRFLLTGSAGFIGSELARELLDAGHSVHGLDDLSGGWEERHPESQRFSFECVDVSGPGTLARVLAEEGPFDGLIHLAARVGVRSVLRDPEGCRASNLRGVREIVSAIEALPSASRPRVYAASSSEVYAHKAGPLHELDPTRGTSGAGRWAYAASKLRGEEILDEAAQLWGPERQPIHLRFFNVVGPGQDSETGMVLPTFIEAALSTADLPLHGDGSQVRTFALVTEVARALRQLVELDPAPAGALNVGGEARTSILDLARAVVEQAGNAGTIRCTDPRSSHGHNFEEISYREPDLGRLRELGIDVPAASLERIVSETLATHLERARPESRTQRGSVCASPAS